jgi:hypothetical protein
MLIPTDTLRIITHTGMLIPMDTLRITVIRTTAAGISSALGVDIVIVAAASAAMVSVAVDSTAMVFVVAADFMAVAAAMAADTDNFHESLIPSCLGTRPPEAERGSSQPTALRPNFRTISVVKSVVQIRRSV